MSLVYSETQERLTLEYYEILESVKSLLPACLQAEIDARRFTMSGPEQDSYYNRRNIEFVFDWEPFVLSSIVYRTDDELPNKNSKRYLIYRRFRKEFNSFEELIDFAYGKKNI